RASDRPGARTFAARARNLARHARVAEQDVGEPRRPLAAVLALLLPAPRGALSGRAARLQRRALVPPDQRGRAVADPRRGGRDDVQPPHHPALRARAGPARRALPAGAASGGMEPPDVGLPA